MLPRCRIFIFTYKRNHLLPRAIESLLKQTFTDWVCEVHDDDPANTFSTDYINSLNDHRFVIKQHPQNLGAVKRFNLAFGHSDEQYASMLEDDNWWEPEFLETSIGFLDKNPHVNMAWSNMQLWEEQPGNSWNNTGKTTWKVNENVIFNWPQQRQVIGHLHSNGAMVWRCNNEHKVPENTLFNAIEAVRERSFSHPIALLAKPMANFAVTLKTNRSADKNEWIATQVMLLASYIKASPNPDQAFKDSLTHFKQQRPNPIANFYLANKWILKERQYNASFSMKDRLFLLKWLFRNVLDLNKIKRYINHHPEVYQYLLENTTNRFNENTSPN